MCRIYPETVATLIDYTFLQIAGEFVISYIHSRHAVQVTLNETAFHCPWGVAIGRGRKRH